MLVEFTRHDPVVATSLCRTNNWAANEPRPEDENVTNHKEWSITCRDIAGRRRDLTVFVRQGRVVLVAPPGETAVLNPLDVGRLRAVLRDAVLDAAMTQEN